MGKGSCWRCKHLAVYKEENEIFWHYRCKRYMFKDEMDPEKMNVYMDCFEDDSTKTYEVMTEDPGKTLNDFFTDVIDNVLY